MKGLLLCFSFLFVSFFSCKPNNNTVKLPPKTSSDISVKTGSGTFNYDLKTPDRMWKLPAPLVEVSGNTWLDKDHLILIEDTHPNLYLIKIDDKNATLEKTIPFQKDDKVKFDIEDVCMVGDKVYALWSHGSLFEINNWNSNPDVREINTGLTKKNNTEGLCYDPVSKKLLIACKDESGIDGEKKSTKAVYQFDTETQKLDEKPFLVIHKDDFEKLAGSKLDFNPSAIVVHPVTHEIYLLSTRDNKCMAVFDREGSLLFFQFMDKDLMPQPEGICFSPEGKLYISSEDKKGDPGNLFEFNVK